MNHRPDARLPHLAKKRALALTCALCFTGPPVVGASAPKKLSCPTVMVTRIDKAAHAGWSVHSDQPLRLTGADIEYVEEGQLEATLDPDSTGPLNDPQLSTSSIFNLDAHRSNGPLTLVCRYGLNAELSRAIPENLKECTIVQHGRFTAIEFDVSCR